MSNKEEFIFDISADTTKAHEPIQELIKTANEAQTALYGMLGILSRMGLDKNVTRAIRDIQRLISTINMLRVSYSLFIATTGPVGLTLAGIGLAGSAITAAGSVVNMLERQVRR